MIFTKLMNINLKQIIPNENRHMKINQIIFLSFSKIVFFFFFFKLQQKWI